MVIKMGAHLPDGLDCNTVDFTEVSFLDDETQTGKLTVNRTQPMQ